MATYTKMNLSGSTNGRPIAVAATSISSGTTIHTAVSGTSSMDEIWIFAANVTTKVVTLTVGWGGTGTSDTILVDVPAKQGLFLVTPGILLQNSLVVKAAASTANVINLAGFVNRIT